MYVHLFFLRPSDDATTQTEGQGENAARMRPIRENHGQHDCPICLGTAEFAIQTNCGHLFCGRQFFIFLNVLFYIIICCFFYSEGF